MVRVANIILRHRGGATTQEADSTTSATGTNPKAAPAAPAPTPAELQTTEAVTGGVLASAPAAEVAPAAGTEAPAAEPQTAPAAETTGAKHSGRRGSGGKAVKREARAEKKEVRQEKRQAKRDARKEAAEARREARAAAALEKKEKAEAEAAAAAAAVADSSDGEASDPDRASLLRRVSQLLGWGGSGVERKEEEDEEEDIEEADDEDFEVEVVGESTEESAHEAQPVEAHDELYVVNDIPIRMTVVEPQPIAAC